MGILEEEELEEESVSQEANGSDMSAVGVVQFPDGRELSDMTEAGNLLEIFLLLAAII